MAPTIKHLLEKAEDVPFIGSNFDDHHASAFLQEFSLDFIFAVFQSNTLQDEDLEKITRALSCVLATPMGTALLPSLVQYGVTAMEISSTVVKKFAIQQLSAVLYSDLDQATLHSALDALFKAFQNEETGIVAQKAILPHFKNEERLEDLLTSHGDVLKGLSRHQNMAVRARALDFLLTLTITSQRACSLLQSNGLLEIKHDQFLSFEDPLGALAIWNVVTVFFSDLEYDSYTAPVLIKAFYPAVETLINSFHEVDDNLKTKLLSCLAVILGLGYPSLDDKYSTLVSNLLVTIKTILDSGSNQDYDYDDWITCVLDALGLLGKSKLSAQLFILHDTQLFQFLVHHAFAEGIIPLRRLIAIRSLADLCSHSTTRDGSGEVENKLRETVFSEIGEHGLWSFLAARLKGPVHDLRLHLYSLIDSLSTRLWFVDGVCSHPPLLDYLCNPLNESIGELCHKRYKAVQRLTDSVQKFLEESICSEEVLGILTNALPQLSRAVEAGPFGVGNRGMESIPIVGTERR